MAKNLTLRLDDEQAVGIESIARVNEQSVSEAIRCAIHQHIAERRKDPEFQKRLKRSMAENAEALRRLAS